MRPYDVMPMHEGRGLPRFSLREIDLPQLVTWEVGGKYYLIVAVEMTGKRTEEYNMVEGSPESDKQKIEGDFKMLSIKLPPDKEVNKMERQAFEGALARARSGKQ